MYKFWPLPSEKNTNIYQSFDVQNLTISLASKLDLSSKSNQVLSCQQRFLTSVPLEIGGFCPLKEITVSQASVGLQWLTTLFLCYLEVQMSGGRALPRNSVSWQHPSFPSHHLLYFLPLFASILSIGHHRCCAASKQLIPNNGREERHN